MCNDASQAFAPRGAPSGEVIRMRRVVIGAVLAAALVLSSTAGWAAETPTADELTVSGTVVFVPDEAPLDGAGGYTDAPAAGGGVWIASDEGPLLPVDPASFQGEVTTGLRFSGTLELGDELERAVDAATGADAPLDEESVLQAVASVAEAEGATLRAEGRISEPVAAAVGARAHTADVAYVRNSSRPVTQADIGAMVTGVGAYWKGQTDGAVTGLSMSRFKSLTTSADKCSPYTLWYEAAKAFGGTLADYRDGRHLIVIVDTSGCWTGGFATVGPVHGGGAVWMDIRARGSNPVSHMTGLLAHEIGHNLGLGHSQSRMCSGTAIDSATSLGLDGSGFMFSMPKAPCRDVEYGDKWDVMGQHGWTKPPGITMAHKDLLGVAPAGAVQTVVRSNGMAQTFTLQHGAAGSGLRGLKVTNPVGGTVYVEYRTNLGQDSGIGLAPGNRVASNVGWMATGVRVVKGYPNVKLIDDRGVYQPTHYIRTSLINHRKAGGAHPGQHQAMAPGDSLSPYDGGLRVRVLETTPTSALVRIEYPPFVDVPYNHAFATDIEWLRDAGVTRVAAGSAYRPAAGVTREEMAAFIHRTAGEPAPASPDTPFPDVVPTSEFAPAIAWMAEQGITTGAGGLYLPRRTISREQMAAFLYRFARPDEATAASSPFADVDASNEFLPAILWMYEQGVTTGIPAGDGLRFDPRGTVTRGQMAAFLHRYASRS